MFHFKVIVNKSYGASPRNSPQYLEHHAWRLPEPWDRQRKKQREHKQHRETNTTCYFHLPNGSTYQAGSRQNQVILILQVYSNDRHLRNNKL